MKTILVLFLLIPSLSWSAKLTSILEVGFNSGHGKDIEKYTLSIQVYSGPELNDSLHLVFWPDSNETINIEQYQFTKQEPDFGYKGEKDFLCLKSTFEKAAEWVEIATKNRVENVKKEIDMCDYRRVAWPGTMSLVSFRFETEMLDFALPTQANRLFITLFAGGVGETVEFWINESAIIDIRDVFNNLEKHFEDVRKIETKRLKDEELFQ